MMGHGVSLLLISAAVGYWVVTKAQAEKGGTRKLGIYLGAAIIVVSVLGAACKIYCAVSICSVASMACPMGGGYGMKKKLSCPMTMKSMPSASQEAPAAHDDGGQ